MDDNDTHSGHNYNVPSSFAVQTSSASNRRQHHQPQHSTRSGQRQPCQPQGTDNSKNGARNRTANAVAQTSAQDELTVNFSVLMVHDETCLFLIAAQRQTSGLTACADPFTQVCNAAEQEAGRKDGTTMTPAHRGGPPQARQAAAESNPLQFPPAANSGLPKKVCGISMPLSPSRRSPSTATP